MNRVSSFMMFLFARENARKARENSAARTRAKPDAILKRYRFCNVRRNDDAVTKYIQGEFLSSFIGHQWFAAVVARVFNLPATLDAVKGHTVPFAPLNMLAQLAARSSAGEPIFNPAYARVLNKGDDSVASEFAVNSILLPLWQKRIPIGASLQGATLAQAHELLSWQNGVGSILAAQVLADYKYLDPARWPDFDTFAVSSPASKAGLNAVWDLPPKRRMTEGMFLGRLLELREYVNEQLPSGEELTAQDVAHTLSAFSKYERIRLGAKTAAPLLTTNLGD